MKRTKVVELHGQGNTDASQEQAAKKEIVEKVSLSLRIPEALYNRIKMESLMSRCSVGSLIEKWAESNANTTDVVVTAETLAQTAPQHKGETTAEGFVTLSAPVSKKHHGMIRLEAFRQNVSIRTLVGSWIEKNVRDWVVTSSDESKETVAESLSAAV